MYINNSRPGGQAVIDCNAKRQKSTQIMITGVDPQSSPKGTQSQEQDNYANINTNNYMNVNNNENIDIDKSIITNTNKDTNTKTNTNTNTNTNINSNKSSTYDSTNSKNKLDRLIPYTHKSEQDAQQTQAKQFIGMWFSLTREQRKMYLWDNNTNANNQHNQVQGASLTKGNNQRNRLLKSRNNCETNKVNSCISKPSRVSQSSPTQTKNITLYKFLLPIMYKDLNLSSIVISQWELCQKFNKFFTGSFKLRTITPGKQAGNDLRGSGYGHGYGDSRCSSNQNPSEIQGHDQIYNLNDFLLINMDRALQIQQVNKKNIGYINVDEVLKEVSKNGQRKFRKISNMMSIYNQLNHQPIQPWKRIQLQHSNTFSLNPVIKIHATAPSTEQPHKFLIADRNIVNRFRSQLLKQDYQLKTNFLNNYLFFGYAPSYNISSQVLVERLGRGSVMKVDDRLWVLYQGTVEEEVKSKDVAGASSYYNRVNHLNQNRFSLDLDFGFGMSQPDSKLGKNYNRLIGQKWKFQLNRGSLICKRNLTLFLNTSSFNNSSSATQKKFGFQSKKQDYSYLHNYMCLTDCIFLTISYFDLQKILKQDPKIKKKMLQKIKQVEATHLQVFQKTAKIQNAFRQSQNLPVQIGIFIQSKFQNKIPKNKRNAKKKIQIYQNNYQQFITFDKYDIMTKNKENVSKKHLIYSQLNNLLKNKQKQQRFIKKMNTQKGMKQIKKCQYEARQKQNKIQHLAIKESIMNTQKFRDKLNQIKFIFDEQIMDKVFKKENQNSRQKQTQKFNRKVKKQVSLFPYDLTQQRDNKSIFRGQSSKQVKSGKKIKFQIQSQNRIQNQDRFKRYESSPNLQCVQTKNKNNIGSFYNINYRKQNRWI